MDPDKPELDPGRAYALVSVSHSGYGWLEEMQAVYRKRGETGEYPVPVNFRYLYQKPENGVLLRDSGKRMVGELKCWNWRRATTSSSAGMPRLPEASRVCRS